MDKNLAPIKGRVLKYLEKQRITKTKFFLEMQISASNFRSKSLFSELNGDVIAKILSYYSDMNPEWLLTGEGSMLKDKSLLKENKGTDYRTTNIPKNISTDKDIEVKTLKAEVDNLRKQLKLKDDLINLLRSRELHNSQNFLGSGFTV